MHLLMRNCVVLTEGLVTQSSAIHHHLWQRPRLMCAMRQCARIRVAVTAREAVARTIVLLAKQMHLAQKHTAQKWLVTMLTRQRVALTEMIVLGIVVLVPWLPNQTLPAHSCVTLMIVRTTNVAQIEQAAVHSHVRLPR